MGVVLVTLGALALPGCCSITDITTRSLPDATVGQPYSFEVEHNCSGEESNDRFEWSLTDGALPAGLRFSRDGRFSGTPTAPGTYSMTLQLSVDTSAEFGFTEARAYSLTVRPAAAASSRGARTRECASA
jgi:hypothetical protein